jgi:hypothetical protein
MHSMKTALRQHLESNNLGSVAELAKKDPRVLSLLVRLSYDKDTLVGWRAITAMGIVARELVSSHYSALRELTRKLLWSLNDESGGIGWSAPELLGEITAADPERFSDLVPIIASVYEIEEYVFRPGVLYALSHIADSAPQRVAAVYSTVLAALRDKNPLTRVFGVEAALKIFPFLDEKKQEEAATAIRGMMTDRAETWIYRGEGFDNVTVGDAAQEASRRIVAKTLKKI